MADEHGFCRVTRKKWISHKSLQRRIRHNSSTDPTEVDTEKFLRRLELLCSSMVNCDYFLSAVETLQQSLQEDLEQPAAPNIQRLVCFGIGPFTRSYQALHQLVFVLCLQRQLDITEASYFDPVLSITEKSLLTSLQCTVLLENCEAKDLANVPTLYYLPHCPNSLANNLLWRNWRYQNLPNVLLINNSFESLTTNKPERWLKEEAKYILDIVPFVKERMLDDDYETQSVFNDLSLHVFPAKHLPPKDSDFWSQHPAPKYKSDEEMIFAEDFIKLTIK